MSEDQVRTGTQLAPTEGGAAAPKVIREYKVVENALGIMDTARFEHLGRVATVMARAGLMPQSLTHIKPPGAADNVVPTALEYEVVQARAFLIANQADLFGMDPNALAQCVSIVHGKLMYEGKLVHALISARLGVDLIYEFGRYDAAKRDILGTLTIGQQGERLWEGEMPATVDDQGLGVRVVGTLPGEAQVRWISGSVAMWNKGAKSPWGNATAWPRQLRYMGAREWCRAYKPSLLLGILTDDEVDEYELARSVGAVAPAAPQLLHAGFEDKRPAEITESPKNPAAARESVAGKRRARAAAVAPKDVLDGDDVPKDGGTRPTDGAAATRTDGAPAAGSEPATSETATPASTDGAEASSGQQGSEPDTSGGAADELPPEPERETTDGEPAADEVYHLADSGWFWDPRRGEYARETYKNGEPFSTAPASKELAIYADHAAEVDGADRSEAQEEDDDNAADLPPEFAAYAKAVDAAKSFGETKKAMSTFYNTDCFEAMSPAQQNKVRADTWDACTESKLADLPDQAADVSAFRLWIEWCEDADAIEGTLSVLEKEPAFAQKDDGFKDAIRKATANRVAILRG